MTINCVHFKKNVYNVTLATGSILPYEKQATGAINLLCNFKRATVQHDLVNHLNKIKLL